MCKCKLLLKYSVETYSVSVKGLSGVYNFVLICLLILDIDFILYSINFFAKFE